MKKHHDDWDLFKEPEGFKHFDAMVNTIMGILVGMIAGGVAFLIVSNYGF